ncbi:MAG TPA: HAMP domain-containing sensor histidine kinase [Solirubrobacteraceae bacterium]|jgi:signal transduction histidine kinase
MTRAPRGLRSIKNRLALLFFAITFVALAVAYVYVAPTLGTGLRTQKLRALQIAAQAYSHRLQGALVTGADRRTLASAVHHAAQLSNDRVTLLGIEHVAGAPRTFYVDDSSAESPGEHVGGLGFAVGDRVVRDRKLLTGTESSANGLVGEAGKPLFNRGQVVGVAIFSGTLNDVERSVAAIRARMLIAGALALALSLLAGYLLARAISLRVGRLEEAAWRVAEGDFSAHFAVDSEDELGQLARALDSMQRQLAQLDSARERFIATASHELRTPIFSIGGFLELIQDEELDEPTRRQFLGQVRTQVERLGQLATGLLDLSRLESGALELRSERIDLAEIVQMVSAEFIPALTQHESELRRRAGPQATIAQCDPERVAQILRVLIDNAIAHTPPGTGIIVSVAIAGHEAQLAVRDFGPGIPASARERIFEPFYTSDEGQGSGLGLAIAHELAERMAGALSVESTPGRTVFTLKLPR